jgi:putative ABC transport system substrate-binding protein
MRRREFTSLVLGAATAWPLASRAQQSGRVPLIGVLMGFAESDPIAQSMVAAFRSALPNLGWTESSNVHIELRWAGPDPEGANASARELAGLRPDALLGQTTPVVRALASVMPNSPIVFVTVSDPIGSGFAASLARPGGNMTGFTVDDSALGANGLNFCWRLRLAPPT